MPAADGRFDPYKIMVSEIMLQQTQVSRVVPKYLAFLEQFPTLEVLARAEQGVVLKAWQGLGYNRRAKFLWQAARSIVNDHCGEFPVSEAELVKLSGIGKNTAGAILAYAFSQPVVYIETNIRTVFIHHFFNDKTGVNDKDLLELVEATLPSEVTMTRVWYWALMDYGSYIKQSKGNLNKLSKHYVKQSAFHGSGRQIRGAIIRSLSQNPASLAELRSEIPDDRLDAILSELTNEELIYNRGGKYSL